MATYYNANAEKTDNSGQPPITFQPIQEPISKREQFAAMAMQGILTGCWQSRDTHNIPDDNLIAQYSTEIADALISQLNTINQNL